MGYLDIQERENIDYIISKTLSEYFNTNVQISKKYRKGCFILNPRLNCAIFDGASKDVRNAVITGHAVHGNLIRSIAMKLFTQYGFSRQGLWNCKYICFDRLPDNSDKLLIMPGNFKVKLFDYKKREITNIIKDGFDNSAFLVEKRIRTEYGDKPYILSMKMLRDGVYLEKMIQGCSLDRFDIKLFPDVKKHIVAVIKDFQKGNRSEVIAENYCKATIDTIKEKLEFINCSDNTKQKIEKFVDSMMHFIGDRLIISDSHGDLQNGNIFISNENEVYIIDWETYAIRSIGYDIITYFYKFRYRTDYIQRIDDFISDIKWEKISSVFWGNIISKKNCLAVYFIEDVLWLVNECFLTEEKKLSSSLHKYAEDDFQKMIIHRLEQL